MEHTAFIGRDSRAADDDAVELKCVQLVVQLRCLI